MQSKGDESSTIKQGHSGVAIERIKRQIPQVFAVTCGVLS
jgi:hypothetical protein